MPEEKEGLNRLYKTYQAKKLAIKQQDWAQPTKIGLGQCSEAGSNVPGETGLGQCSEAGSNVPGETNLGRFSPIMHKNNVCFLSFSTSIQGA
jgi:hypothetical protein